MNTKQWEQSIRDYADAARSYLNGDDDGDRQQPPEPLRTADMLKLIESREYWRTAAQKARRLIAARKEQVGR